MRPKAQMVIQGSTVEGYFLQRMQPKRVLPLLALPSDVRPHDQLYHFRVMVVLGLYAMIVHILHQHRRTSL